MDRLIEFAGNHPWLVAAAVLALLLVIAFELRMRQNNFAAITPQDAIRLSNSGALLLDLRDSEAYANGHIGGARQMSSADVLKASETLKKYKEKPIVVYCDSGSLGASAARVLAGQGFTKVVNLRGGLSGWRAENLPLERNGKGAKS